MHRHSNLSEDRQPRAAFHDALGVNETIEPINQTVKTNYLLCLTALADRVRNLEPIQGNFLTKYFGFFPFDDGDVGPTGVDRTVVDKMWRREIEADRDR